MIAAATVKDRLSNQHTSQRSSQGKPAWEMAFRRYRPGGLSSQKSRYGMPPARIPDPTSMNAAASNVGPNHSPGMSSRPPRAAKEAHLPPVMALFMAASARPASRPGQGIVGIDRG